MFLSLLLWGLARGAIVELTLAPGHVFSFESDDLAMQDESSKKLESEAIVWCQERKDALQVSAEVCATLVTLEAYAQSEKGNDKAQERDHKEATKAMTEEQRQPQQQRQQQQQEGHPAHGQHGLTPQFFEAVNKVFAPSFGTEQLAPLLHSLIRFHRPEQIVELGYGYTTPFIAQALADNAANILDERERHNVQRKAGVLTNKWYAEHPSYAPMLHVVDDQSQRESTYATAMQDTLAQLELDPYVSLHMEMDLQQAHKLFKKDSLGMVWNDAAWDPNFLKTWWPLIKSDGGLLLLHNVIGNGEVSRWCTASPRRVMRELFPHDKFEFLTLLEPHKAHQGSVALLRKLDPAKAPSQWRFLWGGKDADEVDRFHDWNTALQRDPAVAAKARSKKDKKGRAKKGKKRNKKKRKGKKKKTGKTKRQK